VYTVCTSLSAPYGPRRRRNSTIRGRSSAFLDNIVAGTSLGLLGFPAVLSAVIFAVITALMSFVGLYLGRAARRLIPIRSDLLSGIALVIMAVVLALEA
jgi:manganese efflux pump family protein